MDDFWVGPTVNPYRVYVDTSVIGGCFDMEFSSSSRTLFELVKQGKIIILVSDVVFDELAMAPNEVRHVLDELPANGIERIPLSAEALRLRDAYLEAKIVGDRWRDDAAHVALATVARADAIVSWNFKHIVNLNRIKLYNAVNVANGFGFLSILTPVEVIGEHENEEEV